MERNDATVAVTAMLPKYGMLAAVQRHRWCYDTVGFLSATSF